MYKKIVGIVCVSIVLIVISIGISGSELDQLLISETIFVDAIYEPENNLVKIKYTDNSEMTRMVTLEILGMEKTFHKKFMQQSFVEVVEINSAPQYGWATMPVTFTLDHEKFGMIGLKTEIHLDSEMKPRVIYSKI